uniref:SNARE-like protein n=1 Tax=Wallaceina sp. Wsd TaxID=265973 RepID=H9AZI5_9TRYP|nr:SNARE-like protein [Wallaceina sp. Wsd]
MPSTLFIIIKKWRELSWVCLLERKSPLGAKPESRDAVNLIRLFVFVVFVFFVLPFLLFAIKEWWFYWLSRFEIIYTFYIIFL